MSAVAVCPGRVLRFSLLFSVLCAPLTALRLNQRPLVGVLAQKTYGFFERFGDSYIAASYVKYLESAGAQVVPIGIDLTEDQYRKLFYSINGQNVWYLSLTDHPYLPDDILISPLESDLSFCETRLLLPGGGANLVHSPYASNAAFFYKLALQANDNGTYFPVWGTCLGFEELTVLTSGMKLLITTNTSHVPLPLNFTKDATDSRMFKNFPVDLMKALAVEPLSANFHYKSLSVKNFTSNAKLRNFYKILSTNMDSQGIEFVSTMEGKKYPIYGVQWHPEKNPFEWSRKKKIPHSPHAVEAAWYMANFFVNEARKNWHRFSDEVEEGNALIYNYVPVYTGNVSSFQQIYIINGTRFS